MKNIVKHLFISVLITLSVFIVLSAAADDAELLAQLPGEWICPVENDEDETETKQIILTFSDSGEVSARLAGPDGKDEYACVGTWAYELIPDRNDRLTLVFTSTGDPLYAGTEYNVNCVYDVYAETWMESATRVTCLILQEDSCSAVSPLDEMSGEEWNFAFYRKEGPNMRVVKCQKAVSLREKRSKTSRCLIKVPLGAAVFAFPEEKEEKGFIRCVYDGEYGYILSAYLEPLN
ncbi:MAG: hypothetical protein Q4G19_01025 [Clostridia bacterium]|nr:hypothetical protein [Clostridia bacterium]